MKIRYRHALFIGLIVAVLGIALAFSNKWMQEVEHGWFLRIRGRTAPPPEVVIVSINNRAADKLGHPHDIIKWHRSIYADLINRLCEHGAAVIAFDIAFVDPHTQEEDVALASAIRKSNRVVLTEKIHQVPVTGVEEITQSHLDHPIDPLFAAARGVGPFPVEKGTVSRFWAFKKVGGEVPTLPAVVLQIYALPLVRQFTELLQRSGFPAGRLPVDAAAIGGAEDLREYMCMLRKELKSHSSIYKRFSQLLAAEDLPVSKSDRMLLRALGNLYGGADFYYLNLYGYPETIPTISYGDILDGGTAFQAGNKALLKDKAVFVGVLESADPDQPDRHRTVFTQDDGVDLSGVEIAATIFANLLTGGMLQRNIPASIIGLLLFGIAAGSLASRIPGIRAIVLVLALSAFYFCLAIVLFIGRHLWIPLFPPVAFQAPFALFLGLLSQYQYAKKEQARLSVWIPEKIANIPETGLVFCTCLFTDIRGSRKLSNRLSPREYKSLMNGYNDAVKKPVLHNGGRIWDIYGDGMMCLFAAKQKDTGLRLQAATAVMGILLEVEKFNRRQNEMSRLATGIGLHSGWVELGGAQLGDVGNTVSSIESLNRHLSTRILVSQSVVEGLPCAGPAGGFAVDERRFFSVRRIGLFLLPGKTEPVSIFELLPFGVIEGVAGPSKDTIVEFLELSSAALAEFEEHRWENAVKIFEKMLVIHPNDGPARFFMNKCNDYIREQPRAEASVIKI